MKPDIHPAYHPVIFKDAATGDCFITRSTMTSTEKMRWTDGLEYPLITLEVTSKSHPFYTGQQRMLDTMGRVDKFRKRYGQESK